MPPRPTASAATQDEKASLYNDMLGKMARPEAWSLLKDKDSEGYRAACAAWEDEEFSRLAQKDYKLGLKFKHIIPVSGSNTARGGASNQTERKVGDLRKDSEEVVRGDDIAFWDESLSKVAGAIKHAKETYMGKLVGYMKQKDMGGPDGSLTSSVAYGLAAQASEISKSLNRSYRLWEGKHREVCEPDMNDTLFTWGNGLLGDPDAFDTRNAKRRMYSLTSKRVGEALVGMIDDQIQLTEATVPFLPAELAAVTKQDLALLRQNKENKVKMLESSTRAMEVAEALRDPRTDADLTFSQSFQGLGWKIWDIDTNLRGQELRSRVASLSAVDTVIEDDGWMMDTNVAGQSKDGEGKSSNKKKKPKKGKKKQQPAAKVETVTHEKDDDPDEDVRSAQSILSNPFTALAPEGLEARKKQLEEDSMMARLEQLSLAQASKSSDQRTVYWEDVLALAKFNKEQKKIRLDRAAEAQRIKQEQQGSDRTSKVVATKSGTTISEIKEPISDAAWKDIRQKVWRLSHPTDDPDDFKDEPPAQFAQILTEQAAARAEEESKTRRGCLHIPVHLREHLSKPEQSLSLSERSFLSYLKTDADRKRYLNSRTSQAKSSPLRSSLLGESKRLHPSFHWKASEKNLITRPDINAKFTPPSLQGSLYFAPTEPSGEALLWAVSEGMERLSADQMGDFISWANSVPGAKRTPSMLWSIYKRFLIPSGETRQFHPERIFESDTDGGDSAAGVRSSTASADHSVQPINEEVTENDKLLRSDVSLPAPLPKTRRHSVDELRSPDFGKWADEQVSALLFPPVSSGQGTEIIRRRRAFSNSGDSQAAQSEIFRIFADKKVDVEIELGQ